MTDPRSIDLATAEGISHDAGVLDREADVDGTRWALVEYAPGAGRQDWCDTPHSGFVVSGTLAYSFEDGREAFALPEAPRHRGSNTGAEMTQLFIIDALPS
jgi:hypothetical protein